MIGCGVVGGGVWKNLQRCAEDLACRTNVRPEIRRVAVRDVKKDRGIAAELLTQDWRAVIEDEEVQIVVELIGGTTVALEVARAAIEAGKPFVTANKALLAEHGEEICRLADQKGVPLYFEASVAGGIPIIKALREGLQANRIESIHGIINGTCNYILSRMTENGEPFDEVLADAKRLGYAEADEALDVDGIDAAHKAAILASLAYGFWVKFDQVFVEGIRKVEAIDVELARKFGYVIKLLAIIRPGGKGTVEVRVHPTLIPQQHVLASVSGVYNAVAVEGDVVGQTLFYGRGAGADPTSSAVLSDIAEAGVDWVSSHRTCSLSGHVEEGCLLAMDEVETRYYLRLSVLDQPGVLAEVASILGEHNIGISAVFQPERSEEGVVPLVLLLDEAKERVMNEALRKIEMLNVVKGAPHTLRIEDFS